MSEKIKTIIKLLLLLDFKEVPRTDVNYIEKAGGYSHTAKENYILYTKYISENDSMFFRFDKYRSAKKGVFDLVNLYHIKDDVLCFFLFEDDKFLDFDDDCVITSLNKKFKKELRQIKINKVLSSETIIG